MPDEALDPKAVQGAEKIMRAAKTEHDLRQQFEEALVKAASRGRAVRVTQDDLRQKRATDREMMAAAQEHRQAESEVAVALGKLLDAAIETDYLRFITPGEFAFGIEPSGEEDSMFFPGVLRTGEGEQDDT